MDAKPEQHLDLAGREAPGGLLHLWNYADRDDPAGSVSICPDHVAGALCAVGTLATLVGRERGVRQGAHVEVAQVGTVTSFCVVNLQFYGSVMEIPYVSALILLDGADLSIMHLIQEMPADQVRIGMRVEAVWRDDADIEPTLESIKYFRPTGEPDDTDVRIPGEDRGTGLGSWPGGVPPTELTVRNPRTGEGGQA